MVTTLQTIKQRLCNLLALALPLACFRWMWLWAQPSARSWILGSCRPLNPSSHKLWSSTSSSIGQQRPATCFRLVRERKKRDGGG